MFTHVDSFLPMFTVIYSFTYVCTSLPTFTLVSYAYLYLLVFNYVYPCLCLSTYVYHHLCLPPMFITYVLSTYVYPCFLMFTYVLILRPSARKIVQKKAQKILRKYRSLPKHIRKGKQKGDWRYQHRVGRKASKLRKKVCKYMFMSCIPPYHFIPV